MNVLKKPLCFNIDVLAFTAFGMSMPDSQH